MSLLVNLRHLEKGNVHLNGTMPPENLDINGVDELIRVDDPLHYDLEAEKLENSILVRGPLSLDLRCECARCLKAFVHRLELPDWACHLPLEGDDRVAIANDCVDLTPYLREDILLELPRHPLCRPGCGGLPKKPDGSAKKTGGAGQTKESSSAWVELNKLKF